MKFTYTVVIPALNEENTIGETLKKVQELNPEAQIVVSDGGSTDSTLAAAKHYGAEIVTTFTGRGIQMNEGAKTASGEILLFLHADTLLPENAFEVLDGFFSDAQNEICLFSLQFDVLHPVLRLYERFSRFNSVWTNFGDQCICIRKETYVRLGGFAQRMLFEDVEFLGRAKKITRVVTLPQSVITSARKYVKNGYIRQQLHNALLMLKYFAGWSDERIKDSYARDKNDYNKALIIFARYPEPGKVKTRLAQGIGDEGALKFYQYSLKRVFTLCSRIFKPVRVYLFYTGEANAAAIKKWAPKNAVIIKQRGGDLGERMFNAFCTAAALGSKQSVIIGTDIPELTYNMLTDAFKRLDHSPIIIGESEDGGYYLLGMRKPDKIFFENMAWSTSGVYNETLQRAREGGYDVYEMEKLQDIDTIDDLRIYFKAKSRTHLDKDMLDIKSFIPSEKETEN